MPHDIRPPSARFRAAVALALMVAASPAAAGRADVSAKLRQRAIRVCRGDALRFCPGKIFSQRAVVRCMSTKRPKLSPSCRRAFDDVAHALER